jgi:hypothetical protein
MAGPVEINWKDRRASLEALVLPDASEVLLGALPLEALDLLVDSVRQEVCGAHGDKASYIAKGGVFNHW